MQTVNTQYWAIDKPQHLSLLKYRLPLFQKCLYPLFLVPCFTNPAKKNSLSFCAIYSLNAGAYCNPAFICYLLPCEYKLNSPPLPYKFWKPLRPAETGYDSQAYLRLGKPGIFRCNPYMAGYGKLIASADTSAVYGGNYRHIRKFNHIHQLMSVSCKPLPFPAGFYL